MHPCSVVCSPAAPGCRCVGIVCVKATHSKTSLLNGFLLLPRNSPIICRLRPFLCSRKWATPMGVSGMKPREIRNWRPLSGFLGEETKESVAYCSTFHLFIIVLNCTAACSEDHHVGLNFCKSLSVLQVNDSHECLLDIISLSMPIRSLASSLLISMNKGVLS